jgi:hypothetical protein
MASRSSLIGVRKFVMVPRLDIPSQYLRHQLIFIHEGFQVLEKAGVMELAAIMSNCSSAPATD